MRKILLAIFALALTFAVSCSKDDSGTNTPEIVNTFSSQNIYLPIAKDNAISYIYKKKSQAGKLLDSNSLKLVYKDSTGDYRFVYEYKTYDDLNIKEYLELTDYKFSGTLGSKTLNMNAFHKGPSDGKYYVDLNELMVLNALRPIIYKKELLFGDDAVENTTYTIAGKSYPAYEMKFATVKIVFVKKIGVVYMTYNNDSNENFEFTFVSCKLN